MPTVNQNLKLTHLDKIYFPQNGITKGDVLAYYAEISQIILPYLKDKPESLKRFPEGIDGEHFFQKDVKDPPSWAQTIEIPHKDKVVNYLLINDLDSLLYAVNLGCIEIHPFFSRIKHLDFPDFLVFDLDPVDIIFDRVVEVALFLKDTLDELDIPSFCKTSGGRGLHICVPLQAKYSYEQAKIFALLIARKVHRRLPEFTSLERSPKDRKKKVYIDCLQNNPAQTIAAPYSLRARVGAPVSTPLLWKEVKTGLNPLDYNIETILERLKKKEDPFKGVLGKGISLEKILKKLDQD